MQMRVKYLDWRLGARRLQAQSAERYHHTSREKAKLHA